MAAFQSPTSPKSQNGNGGDDDGVEITPIDHYNPEQGKMQASISWLVAKVYGANIPDQLTNLFTKDKDKIWLKPLVVHCLVSGELYCSAASTIFHDSGLINQSHGSVLQTLNRYQIIVFDPDTASNVTETILRQDSPFKLSAHLAMIDGLMTAHMREVISIDRVIGAVKRYTNVHRNEQPVDVENAILFWINKICAAVRDSLEKSRNNQDAPLIPEMDDLYEDICDGTCAATVVHFYQPSELPFHDICFNDPMSIADCAHNLRLLRRFCQRYLPWNIFHFSLEDILYMHESLQPNVNAFFADLFYLLELQQGAKGSPPKPQPRVRRSLSEKVEIPNLRSGDSPKEKFPINKPIKAVPPATTSVRRDNTAMSSLLTSRLNSTDSLATDRSVDSLRYRPYVGSSTESPLTGLAGQPNVPPSRNFTLALTSEPADQIGGGSQYQRSDSLPARNVGPSAAIRLQLEQKRRQYEQQRMQLGSKLAQERQQLSKEAFFTLLGKSGAASASAQPGQQSAAASLQRNKATTPTELARSIGDSSGVNGRGNLEQLAELSKSIHEMRQEMKRLSMEQEKLQKIMEPPTVVNMTIDEGSYGTMPTLTQFQQEIPAAHYATGHFQGPSSASFGHTIPHQLQFQPQQQPQQQSNGATRSLSQLHMARAGAGQTPPAPGASFKLHGDGETRSRLDPSLELTKTMTNWGMTYRIPQKPQRKTWGDQASQQDGEYGTRRAGSVIVEHSQQQQQFVDQADISPNQAFSMYDAASMVEIVPSEPDFVPHYPNVIAASPASVTTPGKEDFRGMRTSNETAGGQGPTAAVSPTSFSGETGGSGSSKSSTPAPADTASANLTSREASPGVGFVVGDDDRKKELELQKKREQIMSNALRRREQLEQRRAQIDAETAKKREEKQQREDMEEQKKRERELHRQKVMQEYQRRKAEQDALDSSGGAAAIASIASSTPQSSRTLPRSQQQQRNHSQPPLRPKSQVIGGKALAPTSPSMVPSGSVDNIDQLENKSQSSDGTGGSGPSAAAAVAPPEPTLKLFVKPSQKTNRNLVLNAIQYCVLAGTVNEPTKQKVLTELAKSDSKHFLILFRDKKCQFKALYSWDQVSDNVHKLFGLGPSNCSETNIEIMFKYDSGGKQFAQIPTRHLSAQIDGFTLKEEYWQRKKPLYSKP